MTGRILPDLRPPAHPAGEPERIYKRHVTAEQVRALFDLELTYDEMAIALGCSLATIQKRITEAGLRGVRPRGRRLGSHVTGQFRLARHAARALVDASATMPPASHPALAEGRTLFPTMVRPAELARRILVSGRNSAKIGAFVTKGRWRGFPIFTLTLEERASCPTSCGHWRSCYGNGMHAAVRLIHGPLFEARLADELAALQRTYPDGFAVRLHVLGDFYSVAYVDLWRSFLARFPALAVFGFSRRWEREDPIAMRLVRLVIDEWQRFAIRFSDAPVDECASVSIEHPLQKPADAVLCPQQLGKTATCGTCGFCWHSRRRVAFLQH